MGSSLLCVCVGGNSQVKQNETNKSTSMFRKLYMKVENNERF